MSDSASQGGSSGRKRKSTAAEQAVSAGASLKAFAARPDYTLARLSPALPILDFEERGGRYLA